MLAQPPRQPSTFFHHHQPYQTSSSSLEPSSYSSYPSADYSQVNCDADFLQSASADHAALFDYDAPQNFNNLHIHVDSSFESSQEPELMHWNYMHGQLTPTSARSHYRESSLSSIGSTGPASPFSSSTPHPHVVLPSDSEIHYDGMPMLEQTSYNNFPKPLTPSHTPSQDNFLMPPFSQSYNTHTYNANAHVAALLAMRGQHQALGDDESMSASEYSHSGRPSVASTHDSPATPSVAGDFDDQTRKHDFRSVSTIPKLDRTMSDVYNDELYSPSFTFTPAPSAKVEPMTVPNPGSAVFSQMLQAANDQHLSAPLRSPMNDPSRDQKIAFREGSPLAPVSNEFGSPQVRFGSAQQMRERRKAASDERMVQQQLQRHSPTQTAPNTISPRDALLDYHQSEEDAAMPLFPTQHAAPQYGLQTGSTPAPAQPDREDTASQQSFGSMATTRRQSSSAYSTPSQVTQQPRSNFTFPPPAVVSGARIPQQYPFVSQSQQRSQQGSVSALSDRATALPSTPSTMRTGNGVDTTDLKKPAGCNADGGTYTCTYHGCTLRFETPAKLQKHKREGHRQSAPVTGAPASTQAGPHRCLRVNPSTNKVCNTIFSRPYDLTRHEDTIHNARKIKVRCHLCKEEKTFSRNDALTRHMKLVHPNEVTLSTKKRV